MPKFSIIIGVYNQAENLPKLFEALRLQTYRDFEVHFCDDGSDDESAELIREACEKENIYAGRSEVPRAWHYHRQDHKGYRLAKNLNQGIKAAAGEYVLVIMADSFPDTDYLDTLARYVAPHRVVCGIRIQVHEGVGVDVDFRLKKDLIPQENSIVMTRPWNALTGNGIAYPAAALREHGAYNEKIEGYGGEDTELLARLFFKGYIMWSVVDLRLFHNWHKSKTAVGTPEINKMIYKLAS